MSQTEHRLQRPIFADNSIRFPSAETFTDVYKTTLWRGAMVVQVAQDVKPLLPYQVNICVPGFPPLLAQVRLVSSHADTHLFQLIDEDGAVQQGLAAISQNLETGTFPIAKIPEDFATPPVANPVSPEPFSAPVPVFDDKASIPELNLPPAAHPVPAHPVPQTAHPVPQTAHPVPQSAHPVPQAAQPAPHQPVSQTAQPAPYQPVSQTADPVSQTADPVPQMAQPVPQTAEPVPQMAQPVPLQPVPQPAQPVSQTAQPASHQPVSQTAQPAPHQPVPQTGPPVPQTGPPVPQTAQPVPLQPLTPQTAQPVSQTAQPVSQMAQPAPHQPVPQMAQPAPHQPVSQTAEPVPQTAQPVPQPAQPVPQTPMTQPAPGSQPAIPRPTPPPTTTPAEGVHSSHRPTSLSSPQVTASTARTNTPDPTSRAVPNPKFSNKKVRPSGLHDAVRFKVARVSSTAARASRTTIVHQPQGEIANVVGIDFGQTFCGIAAGRGDTVYMVRDGHDHCLSPSIINYPEKGDPVVAWEARPRMMSMPHRTIFSIKRMLGRKFSDPMITGFLQAAPFRTIAGPNDSIAVTIEGERYAVTQICADMLRYLCRNASKRLGYVIKKVVLSHPVTYDDSGKEALVRAANMAGLDVVGMIQEPVAAALAYGCGRARNEIVAVYDFGGGTFDFSIIDMSFDRHRVLTCGGDGWLGGDDFDMALAEAVSNLFWKKTNIELRHRAVEWQRLLYECEQAKRRLSEYETTDVVLHDLVQNPTPLDLEQRVTRHAFMQLTYGHFQRSLEVCRSSLEQIGLEPLDITQLVLSGGTSRIPYIRQGLEQFFEREASEVIHPEEAVALGTGLHAAQLSNHTARRAVSLS